MPPSRWHRSDQGGIKIPGGAPAGWHQPARVASKISGGHQQAGISRPGWHQKFRGHQQAGISRPGWHQNFRGTPAGWHQPARVASKISGDTRRLAPAGQGGIKNFGGTSRLASAGQGGIKHFGGHQQAGISRPGWHQNFRGTPAGWHQPARAASKISGDTSKLASARRFTTEAMQKAEKSHCASI